MHRPRKLFDLRKQGEREAGIGSEERGRAIENFIAGRRETYAPRIKTSLVDRMRISMINTVRAGGRISDMQRNIRSILIDQAPFRALRIVRTEVVGGLNAGSLASYKASNVTTGKRWLTARDGAVRVSRTGMPFSHKEADGQEVRKEDPFIVSGEALQHPGDSAGSAGNIINCRCTMTPIVKVPPPPKPLRGPRDPKAPVRFTDAEVEAWLDQAQDPETRRLMERAVQSDPRFRNLVLTDQVARGTDTYLVRNLDREEAWGQYWSDKRLVEIHNGIPSLKDRASVTAHEMFHGVTYDRGWFNRFGFARLNLQNAEAVRLLELYNNSLDRVENVLEAKAKVKPRFGGKKDPNVKKFLKRIKKARAQVKFGTSSQRSIPFWDEMRDAHILDAEKAGIPRMYALKNPAEYSTTSYQDYIFNPKRLQRRDPDMFNFFENFYRDGVFKQLTDFLRSL